jgi:biotin transporter BioY
MKQNLGNLDRILRFILALWLVSPLAPRFWEPWLHCLVFVIALIVLVESMVGYCPLMNWLGINNKD